MLYRLHRQKHPPPNYPSTRLAAQRTTTCIWEPDRPNLCQQASADCCHLTKVFGCFAHFRFSCVNCWVNRSANWFLHRKHWLTVGASSLHCRQPLWLLYYGGNYDVFFCGVENTCKNAKLKSRIHHITPLFKWRYSSVTLLRVHCSH